jgi:hypothetical protein
VGDRSSDGGPRDPPTRERQLPGRPPRQAPPPRLGRNQALARRACATGKPSWMSATTYVALMALRRRLEEV